jgi:hypothetical protein
MSHRYKKEMEREPELFSSHLRAQPRKSISKNNRGKPPLSTSTQKTKQIE